ncbi:hypothetical protein Ciccas_005117 [Cichlidogyrus casuarinus]|uniref:Uncharacterized protein n=1 Tax=Cichlidogyrus casuarinus TaxID=1844966 RepID=A0ABD2Q9K4_9PLAT
MLRSLEDHLKEVNFAVWTCEHDPRTKVLKTLPSFTDAETSVVAGFVSILELFASKTTKLSVE